LNLYFQISEAAKVAHINEASPTADKRFLSSISKNGKPFGASSSPSSSNIDLITSSGNLFIIY